MFNSYPFYLFFVAGCFLSGCRAKSDTQPETLPVAVVEEILAVDTPLFNPDTAGYLLQLPMGNPQILKKWKNYDRFNKIHDSYIFFESNFCDTLLCGGTMKYDPSLLKEGYYEGHSMYLITTEQNLSISKRMFQIDSLFLYFALHEKSKTKVKFFLLSVKNNQIVDSKEVYYSAGEGGYIHGRLFYIDQYARVFIRDYYYTDEGPIQSLLSQFILNSQGQFVQCYDKDGLYQTKEERGMVKNHLREGKWIEKKSNYFLHIKTNYNFDYSATYLEAEYRAGVPVGEWRFYRLDIKPEQDLSTATKGEWVYTEMYENGVLKERIFAKELQETLQPSTP